MSTTNLPIDVSAWNEDQKKTTLALLVADLMSKHSSAPLIVETNALSYLLVGPVGPARTVILDDHSEEVREIKRRHLSDSSIPLDVVIAELRSS